jgi:transcription elongation factor
LPKNGPDRWPPAPPPRIDAFVALQRLRENLRARISYVVDTLGYRPRTIARAAGMSVKGLDGYDQPDWNAAPATMIKTDETIERQLATWIEGAKLRRQLSQTKAAYYPGPPED